MLTTVMLATGAIGLLLLRRVITDHRTHWDLTTTFIIAIGITVNSAAFVAVYRGRYAIVYNPIDQYYERVLRTVDSPVFGALLVSGAIISIFVFLMRIARVKINGAPAFALALWFVMNNASGTLGTRGALFMAAVLLAATTMRPGRGAWLGAAVVGLLMAITSAFFTALRPDDGSRACFASKCGPLDTLIPGATNSENALALAVALSMPFAWLVLQGRLRTTVLLYGAAVVFMTGSRTSLFTVVAILLLTLLAPRVTPHTPTIARGQLAVPAIVATALVAYLVPRLPGVDPTTFSTRGHLWQLAHFWSSQEPWFGYGADGWSRLYSDRSVINAGAIYSPHNQWLEIQFSAGLVGMTIFAIWLISLMRGGGGYSLAILLIPPLVAGIAERPWSFGLPDWLTWAFIALCVGVPRDWSVDQPAPTDEAKATERARHRDGAPRARSPSHV